MWCVCVCVCACMYVCVCVCVCVATLNEKKGRKEIIGANEKPHPNKHLENKKVY